LPIQCGPQGYGCGQDDHHIFQCGIDHGQKFKVTQRNDIDSNYVVKSGKHAGKTNKELMQEGYAPYTNSGKKVILHHIGQDANGPLVEVAEKTHNPLLHRQYGSRESHPTNPVVRSKFGLIRKEYWKTYGKYFE
jgi:hypothetical protein